MLCVRWRAQTWLKNSWHDEVQHLDESESSTVKNPRLPGRKN